MINIKQILTKLNRKHIFEEDLEEKKIANYKLHIC